MKAGNRRRPDLVLAGLVTPPPSLWDVERAMLAELEGHAAAERPVPSAWQVRLAARDQRRRRGQLPHWGEMLAERILVEQRRLGLAITGLVTVSFAADPDLRPGRFQVVGAAGPAAAQLPPAIARVPQVPGRPRLTVSAGGTARQGSPAAHGIEREVLLPLGAFVIGRDRSADLRLLDPAVSPRHAVMDVGPDGARLRDLGSLNGTRVDGVGALMVDLVDGNRIEVGPVTLVFHRDEPDQ